DVAATRALLQDGRGEIVRRRLGCAAEEHGARDCVLELAHVARPRVRERALHRFVGEPLDDRLRILRARFGDELRDEEGDIVAPVNAPFTWPKSSLSRRFSGKAAQFTDTKGPLARPERPWSTRATRPLPVPVSPRNTTGTSASAMRSTSSRTSRIAALSPTNA